MSTFELKKAADGFYHPSSEQEITQLILKARETKEEIRVRGAAHSVKKSIYTDGYKDKADKSTGYNIMLDQFRSISIDEAAMTVTCDSGINLGPDPYDPSGTSTLENSLLYQINEKGLALGDLGGITHQTVAGFLATGSSGGSLNYDLGEQILAIRLIDGTGKVHDLRKDDADPRKFNAAGVSMGLLGIVTQVTFQCEPVYHIMGSETITTMDDAEMNVYGPSTASKPSYMDFLFNAPLENGDRNPRLAEYSRMLWWPQKGVQRIVNWKAHRMAPEDYNAETGTPENFKPQPYLEAGYAFTAEMFEQLPPWIIGLLICFVENNLEPWFDKLIELIKEIMKEEDEAKIEEAIQLFLENSKTPITPESVEKVGSNNGAERLAELLTEASKPVFQAVGGLFYIAIGNRYAPESNVWYKWFKFLFKSIPEFEAAYPSIMTSLFVQENTDKPQQFWDTWWQGLPMDNQIDDLLLPTRFTELWIPIEQTEAVMTKLNTFFTAASHDSDTGLGKMGTFSYEFYGTNSSDFWMSPSYGQNVVRVDVFWFAYNYERPVDSLYPEFWSLLQEFDYRLHWGKFLVQNTPSVPSDYLESRYPKWGNWMEIRKELDPDNIFLNNYWKKHLNLG